MQFHFSKVFQQFVSAFSMRILRPQQGKGGKITKSQICHQPELLAACALFEKRAVEFLSLSLLFPLKLVLFSCFWYKCHLNLGGRSCPKIPI